MIFFLLFVVGYAAGTHYNSVGGGAELLCLPESPTWGHISKVGAHAPYVYGAEYQLNNAHSTDLFGDVLSDQNVPCVVCQSVGRFDALRIPGIYILYTLSVSSVFSTTPSNIIIFTNIAHFRHILSLILFTRKFYNPTPFMILNNYWLWWGRHHQVKYN